MSVAVGRSQLLRGLMRGPPASRLQRLGIRIRPGAWMPVSCEWCVLSRRGLCIGPITRLKEPHS